MRRLSAVTKDFSKTLKLGDPDPYVN
jgi:hypothetical protein